MHISEKTPKMLQKPLKNTPISHGMAADTRKDRYTVLNEVALTEELLGGIYEEQLI